jgi:phosphohistidine phosphatase SixA
MITKINLIDIILLVFFASMIIIVSKMFTLKSTYEHDTNELAKQIHTLSETNKKLQYQVEHQPSLEDLKLQLKLVEDGASIEEAKLIIEQSTEAGLSPKL